MVKEANISERPWLEEGISRRTYYRNKANIGDSATISAKVVESSAKRVPNGTPEEKSAKSVPPCPLHPNKPTDITRAQTKKRLETQAFIPSWYSNEKKFRCKEEAIKDVMNMING